MKNILVGLVIFTAVSGAFGQDCSSTLLTNCFHEVSASNLKNISFTPTPGNIRVDFQNNLNLNKNFYFVAGSDMEGARSMLAILLTAKQQGYSIRAYIQFSGSSGYTWDNYNAQYTSLTLVP